MLALDTKAAFVDVGRNSRTFVAKRQLHESDISHRHEAERIETLQ